MESEERIDMLTRRFREHYALVVAAARRYAPFTDHVDDIVQQVYLDFACGGLEDKWDLERDIGPLLYQITKRKAQMERRRDRTCSIDLLADRFAAFAGDDRFQEVNEDKIRALRECLKKLPERSRRIVEQHYFEEIPMTQIAGQNGKNITAIYHFFFRVRQNLRECIERTMSGMNRNGNK